MPQIIIASRNPVKIQATINAFQRMFPGENFTSQGAEAPGDTPDQPMSEVETFTSAQARARHAMTHHLEGDFWVGIEGGVEAVTDTHPEQPDEYSTKDQNGTELAAFAWVIVLSKSEDGRTRMGKGRKGTFYLPPAVAKLVQQGLELGDADDIVFGLSNSKQVNGAVGILTDNVIDRLRFYEQAVILALIPFKNASLYAS